MRPRRGLLALVCGPVLWAAVIAAGAEDARPVPRDPSAPLDVQEIIFLGPMRPLLMRLHITVDGRPFRQVWQERFDELFALEDRQQSGRLTIEQGENIARDMNGGLRDTRQADVKGLADSSGNVDRAALAAAIEKAHPVFAVRRRSSIARDSALALFPLLDTDRNHQLSEAELAHAEEQLRQRDFNDDGVITRGELILDPNAIAAAADPNAADRELDPDDSPVLALDGSVGPEQIAERLLKHYDRNRDGRLTSVAGEIEMLLPPALWSKLDANGDGALDRVELARLADRVADLDLTFAMGRAASSASRRRQRADVERGFRVRETLQNGYKLEVGDSKIDFLRENRDPRQADLVELRTFDRDQNGYLDPAEAAANNVGKAVFAAMDTDGDGKVYKGEFNSFMTRQNAAAAMRFQLEVMDLGQELFEVLDQDGDGVLSQRELREAKKILAVADSNGDGALAGEELPQRFSFKLVRGVDDLQDQVMARTAAARSTAKANTSGPLWFRKMDRNNDGDVSQHEFVGPQAAFRKLDANGDGFIDREEAEAAEK